jgi:hypothetical protein
MLTLAMNDSAAHLLDALTGLSGLGPTGGLTPRLRELLLQGIVRRGDVLVWANSVGNAVKAPPIFPDFTGWECADSSFHIEDFVPVSAHIVDGEPRIGEADQRLLLQHGIAFALGFSHLVYERDTPAPVRCIVSANETNATFRFHQIRAGESWTRANLDDYRLEKIVVLDITPDRSR